MKYLRIGHTWSGNSWIRSAGSNRHVFSCAFVSGSWQFNLRVFRVRSFDGAASERARFLVSVGPVTLTRMLLLQSTTSTTFSAGSGDSDLKRAIELSMKETGGGGKPESAPLVC